MTFAFCSILVAQNMKMMWETPSRSVLSASKNEDVTHGHVLFSADPLPLSLYSIVLTYLYHAGNCEHGFSGDRAAK